MELKRNKLSSDELQRYTRHISLEEFRLESQLLLSQSKVLVVGAGGLGAPVLQYLTAAGIGCIGVVDGDKVDVTNLQRQVIFTEQDVGHYKVDRAIARLKLQNSHVEFIPHSIFLTKENALDIISQYDVIVDGSDNFPCRYLVNDACVITKKTLVFGSIFKFEGQVSVFNYQNGPTYRCLYPEPPSSKDVPNCSEVGVIGTTPAVIGSYMSNEVIKILTQIGEVLKGKLLSINLLTNTTTVFHFEKDYQYGHITALGNYDFDSCDNSSILEIQVDDLNHQMKNKDLWILDVRNPYEYDTFHLENSHLIPLNTLDKNMSKIPKDKSIIVICHRGMRSLKAAQMLIKKGFKKVKTLSGGMESWIRYHSLRDKSMKT